MTEFDYEVIEYFSYIVAFHLHVALIYNSSNVWLFKFDALNPEVNFYVLEVQNPSCAVIDKSSSQCRCRGSSPLSSDDEEEPDVRIHTCLGIYESNSNISYSDITIEQIA